MPADAVQVTADTSTKAADIAILRDLAKRYAEVSQKPVQDERRDLWRRHNGLEFTRPLIYVRAYAWCEMPESKCQCEDRFLRQYESQFRRLLFWDSLNDDSIFEPWITVQAATRVHENGLWGLAAKYTHSDFNRGSNVWESPIKDLDDIKKIVKPHHEIDEEATTRKVERLQDAIGDIITINVDRGPVCRMWNADISTQLGKIRGLEEMMLDMIEEPEWLHELLTIMRDGILQNQQEAEDAGDWTLCDQQNQAMAYAKELEDPAANSKPVKRKELWNFCASQETTGVGPAMFNEFMLEYQIPIMANFGLSAYGCCEDLTSKIDVVKQIPNLRRISLAPLADVPKCVEKIGTDYVISYRPSPADMVSYDFDPERIRTILRSDLSACRDLHVDITLKDVETVEGDTNRVREWVKITREVIDELWG